VFVVVPVDVFFTITDTFGNGVPASSVTVPDTGVWA
jgi:hypothetical protein